MIIRILMVLALLMFSSTVRPTADGPDFWRVVNVLPDGFLNMRKGPSIKFSVIARIPHGTSGLDNLGCSPDFNATEWAEFTLEESKLALRMRWCRVAYQGTNGWVHSKYLVE